MKLIPNVSHYREVINVYIVACQRGSYVQRNNFFKTFKKISRLSKISRFSKNVQDFQFSPTNRSGSDKTWGQGSYLDKKFKKKGTNRTLASPFFY